MKGMPDPGKAIDPEGIRRMCKDDLSQLDVLRKGAALTILHTAMLRACLKGYQPAECT